MKIWLILLIAGLCPGLCQDQTLVSTFFDVIGLMYNSIAMNVNKVFSSRIEEFREFEDCGKRRKIDPSEFLFNDCLWGCKWKHNPFYKHGNEYIFDDEKITTFITTPRVPQDLACLSDCFIPSREFRDCYKCCFCNPSTCSVYDDTSSTSKQVKVGCLFKCLREKRATIDGKFWARTFNDMALEFCRISLSQEAKDKNLFPNGDCLTVKFKLPSCKVAEPSPVIKKLGHRRKDRGVDKVAPQLKRFNLNPFRGKSGESKETHKIVSSAGRPGLRDDDRIFGASVFPVDLTPDTRFHPWLCSLRTRGFRGRHRCGVTLLSGPTEAEKHATVLVGAAHCNYICKERESGNIYETCCCRPESSKASCKKTSSYCRGDPIFTLADADDLQIVCGEFSIESPEPEVFSREGEQVLDILKIINHPDYQPNQDPGVGGPLEGNDISVYIVDDSQFKMSNAKK